MVAETEVRQELAKLLKTVDFATTSERQIRQRLCDQLGADVLSFKDVIKVGANVTPSIGPLTIL